MWSGVDIYVFCPCLKLVACWCGGLAAAVVRVVPDLPLSKAYYCWRSAMAMQPHGPWSGAALPPLGACRKQDSVCEIASVCVCSPSDFPGCALCIHQRVLFFSLLCRPSVSGVGHAALQLARGCPHQEMHFHPLAETRQEHLV